MVGMDAGTFREPTVTRGSGGVSGAIEEGGGREKGETRKSVAATGQRNSKTPTLHTAKSGAPRRTRTAKIENRRLPNREIQRPHPSYGEEWGTPQNENGENRS